MRLTKSKEEVLENLKKRFNIKESKTEVSDVIEDTDEEPQSDYRKGGYCKISEGEPLNQNEYYVIKKIGWGYFSTVWLAWSYSYRDFVAIKVAKSAIEFEMTAIEEIEMMKKIQYIEKNNEKNMKYGKMLDSFVHRSKATNEKHTCMVFEWLDSSVFDILKKREFIGYSIPIVKRITRQLLETLKPLHEANIIHTDIKPENILVAYKTVVEKKKYQVRPTKLQEIQKEWIPPKEGVPIVLQSDQDLTKKQKKKKRQKLEAMKKEYVDDVALKKALEDLREECENQNPIKLLDETKETQLELIETSKDDKNITHVKESPFIQEVDFKLIDFGNARYVPQGYGVDEIQTREYRAPEVILKLGWHTPSDIWSVACVVFELLTGIPLFKPKTSGEASKEDDHLAQILERTGLSRYPSKYAAHAKRYHKFFNREFQFLRIKSALSTRSHLEDYLRKFLPQSYIDQEQIDRPSSISEISSFLLPMLHPSPKKRPSASECLQHSFLS